MKSFQNALKTSEKGPFLHFPRFYGCPAILCTKFCPHGEERWHDGGSIVLPQTARAPARLQPSGEATIAALLRNALIPDTNTTRRPRCSPSASISSCRDTKALNCRSVPVSQLEYQPGPPVTPGIFRPRRTPSHRGRVSRLAGWVYEIL